MKGQVLGFDGTSGAINGEDGKRYRFKAADWRDEKAAAARDQVDFVTEGDEARDIYRIKAAFSVAMPDASFVEGERLEQLKAYAARPQLLLALVLVLSSLFLTFMEGGTDGLPLTKVSTVYSTLSTAIEQQQAMTGQEERPSYFGSGTAGIDAEIAYGRQKLIRDNQAAADRKIFSIAYAVSYALWLIPLGAAFIIYREFRNRRSRLLEMLVGAGALLSPLYIPLTRYAVGHAMGGIAGYALGNAANAVSFGFGALVVAATGIGLLLTATNRLKRTLGL